MTCAGSGARPISRKAWRRSPAPARIWRACTPLPAIRRSAAAQGLRGSRPRRSSASSSRSPAPTPFGDGCKRCGAALRPGNASRSAGSRSAPRRPVARQGRHAAHHRRGHRRRHAEARCPRPSAPEEVIHAELTALKGIGPWTADIYIMFSWPAPTPGRPATLRSNMRSRTRSDLRSGPSLC